jgi:hypothetical protein
MLSRLRLSVQELEQFPPSGGGANLTAGAGDPSDSVKVARSFSFLFCVGFLSGWFLCLVSSTCQKGNSVKYELYMMANQSKQTQAAESAEMDKRITALEQMLKDQDGKNAEITQAGIVPMIGQVSMAMRNRPVPPL